MIQLLCVEDDPIVRAYLEALLSRRPEVEIVGLVGDAASAFRYLREGQIDVLLLDYQMQGMNGMDLLQAIYLWESSGESPGRGGRPRVLFFTGCADEEFESRARELGANGVVSKSSLTEELIAAIRTVAAGGIWFGHIPGREGSPGPGGLRRALVAETDRMVRASLNALLPQLGYSVSLAWKGTDVVSMLQQEPYDLLLLDHRLPGMIAGRSVFEQLEQRWPELPVLLLAGTPDAADYRPCANVRGAVLKPVSAQQLQRSLADVSS